MCSGLSDLDRVFGGGLVPGAVMLLGGEPGIGKSTLLLQLLARLGSRDFKVLYVTGEESLAQVAMRSRRIGGEGMSAVSGCAETDLDAICEAIQDVKPHVIVIDSIQTVRCAELMSAAGTVGQLREVAARLVQIAKSTGATVLLVGHVTKDGSLAGPKVLEHLVDTVLAFEGDRTYAYRIVRSVKNRFGPANEVAVFEMAGNGLAEVPDPSALFLAERRADASGSVVMATAEGERALLVEVQALVAPAAYGSSRRVANGLDPQRLSVLLAVLHRKVGLHLLDQDVFASVAGGIRVTERGVDLASTLAVASSFRDRPLPEDLVAFGEVGLAGEVRAVPRADIRLAEAAKLGFRRAIIPKGNVSSMPKGDVSRAGSLTPGIEVTAVGSVEAALEAVS